MSIFVWVMMGIAIWHACVLVPDRFYGGLIGAFLTAVVGAAASGFLLPVPGVPPPNPPGLDQALWPVPGCLIGRVALYFYGAFTERAEARDRAIAEPR